MKILAIIPARGGSKRLKNKNILNLLSKPLIAWSIEVAKKSKYITEVVVSTDSPEIAEASKKFGAKVPFMRPDYLSSDTATSYDAVEHCIHYYKEELGKEYDYVLLLQPTSPLRTTEDIDNAIELVLEKKADSVVSMCECEHSPLWANTLPEDHSINDFDKKEYKDLRSQDLPIHYRYNGAIYLSKTSRLLKEKTFNFSSNSYAYIMNQENSVDIDTKLDFMIAETIMNRRYEQ
ncbi:MAG: acylneuraminate cytidylyltransferase family protein [Marinifilaceae bacterium]|jgi:N-acylneuraminate cytidylyltransferase|nr:acylneuraminate cytidylyltransferase family protein [Marinifilaceae bacterium]